MCNIQHWKNWKKKNKQALMNTIHSQNGLNCVRAYRNPELTYDYKNESDIRLIKTNPMNRVSRQYMSKNKSVLCYDTKIPIQLIQYSKETKHVLKTNQMDLVINSIESEWTFFKLFLWLFRVERENRIYLENQVITDISINNCIQSLTNIVHQQIIHVCYDLKHEISSIYNKQVQK